MVGKAFFVFVTFLLAVTLVGVVTILFAAGGLLQRMDFDAEAQMPHVRMHDRMQRHTAAWAAAGTSRVQFAAVSAESASANLLKLHRNTPIFEERGAAAPFDSLAPQMVQGLRRQGNWLLVRSWRGEKWIYTEWLPDAMLMDVPVLNQQALGFPTGCEIISLGMLIQHRREVDIHHLVAQMPRSYDPWLGFRGDPRSRGGFTILPPALMALTEQYMGSAKDMTGASIEEVQAQLAQERPVLAWVRGMFGFTVHVIVLTGFNQEGFFYNDSWLGGHNNFITYEDFLAMWEDPIIDRILNRVYPIRMALSY